MSSSYAGVLGFYNLQVEKQKLKTVHFQLEKRSVKNAEPLPGCTSITFWTNRWRLYRSLIVGQFLLMCPGQEPHWHRDFVFVHREIWKLQQNGGKTWYKLVILWSFIIIMFVNCTILYVQLLVLEFIVLFCFTGIHLHTCLFANGWVFSRQSSAIPACHPLVSNEPRFVWAVFAGHPRSLLALVGLGAFFPWIVAGSINYDGGWFVSLNLNWTMDLVFGKLGLVQIWMMWS